VVYVDALSKREVNVERTGLVLWKKKEQTPKYNKDRNNEQIRPDELKKTLIPDQETR